MLITPDQFPHLDGELRHLLDAFTNLKDIKLRRSWEGANGIYLAESANVIARALEVGHRPRAFFATPKWLNRLPDVDVPIFLVPEEESEQVTGFRVHRGALAAMERPAPTDAAELLASLPAGRRHAVAVLEGLVDHTNVGAIFRSAAALGMSAVLLDDTCADPLYRRSIRTSMGAVFQVPWARLHSWPQTQTLTEAGYLVCALTPAAGAVRIDEIPQDPQFPNLALALGSEGPGLTRAALRNLNVTIPIVEAVDSLNVSTAAAISFWEAQRYIR